MKWPFNQELFLLLTWYHVKLLGEGGGGGLVLDCESDST